MRMIATHAGKRLAQKAVISALMIKGTVMKKHSRRYSKQGIVGVLGREGEEGGRRRGLGKREMEERESAGACRRSLSQSPLPFPRPAMQGTNNLFGLCLGTGTTIVSSVTSAAVPSSQTVSSPSTKTRRFAQLATHRTTKRLVKLAVNQSTPVDHGSSTMATTFTNGASFVKSA